MDGEKETSSRQEDTLAPVPGQVEKRYSILGIKNHPDPKSRASTVLKFSVQNGRLRT
jgi:hypothetical protein